MPADPFVGQIMAVGFNFAPRGWALCNGQLLPINQNQALFSLLGTTYGGDGRVTFALPNLQTRAAIGRGAGPGLTNRTQGVNGGLASVSLAASHLPSHTHGVQGAAVAGTSASPADQTWAQVRGRAYSGDPLGAQDTMAADSLALSGGGQPHNNRSPYLAVYFAIALQGIFPSRN